ncbi:GntR family transcriptional regulator [Streptomyces nigrescens]|uniref:GntR family transcriptional regulator n=1 Tax=Streptomyces nigrescens TaxID=1920 RepID=UPI0036C2DBC7
MTNPHVHANEPTALYRLYDADDQLLYIGIARYPQSRWEQHAGQQTWWHQVARKTVEWYEDRASALEAEACSTAAEKPLYDQSWRRTQDAPKGGFDDSAGRKLVEKTLADRIAQGLYPPGTCLSTGTVSSEFDVARTTASCAMRALVSRGMLRHRVHGRYLVADPAPPSDPATHREEATPLPLLPYEGQSEDDLLFPMRPVLGAPAPVAVNWDERFPPLPTEDRDPKPRCIRVWRGACDRPAGMACNC